MAWHGSGQRRGKEIKHLVKETFRGPLPESWQERNVNDVYHMMYIVNCHDICSTFFYTVHANCRRAGRPDQKWLTLKEANKLIQLSSSIDCYSSTANSLVLRHQNWHNFQFQLLLNQASQASWFWGGWIKGIKCLVKTPVFCIIVQLIVVSMWHKKWVIMVVPLPTV